ncbi:MAG: lysophospholipase [Saprospiraceae bacterium]
MAATEFSWTTKDGLNIYAKHWPASNAPKGVIALVHGLGEHANRYNHFADFFNKNGYSVVGYDRRGHGKSEGKRGHTPSYAAFLNEIAQLLVETEELYPDLPTFLYGHSMGGNLGLKYSLDRHPTLNGVVVTGPHIRLSFQPPAIKVGLAKLVKSIAPSLIQDNELDPTHVSSDPAVVRDYIKDPLVHSKISIMTVTAMLESAAWLDKYKGKVDIPTLLMHGSDDKITSYQGSKDFAARVKGEDVTFKGWDGFYHEIHNEKEQLQVFEYTLDWLNKHI